MEGTPRERLAEEDLSLNGEQHIVDGNGEAGVGVEPRRTGCRLSGKSELNWRVVSSVHSGTGGANPETTQSRRSSRGMWRPNG